MASRRGLGYLSTFRPKTYLAGPASRKRGQKLEYVEFWRVAYGLCFIVFFPPLHFHKRQLLSGAVCSAAAGMPHFISLKMVRILKA